MSSPEGGPILAQVTADGNTYLKGVGTRLAIFGPLIVIGLLRPGSGDLQPWVYWTIVGLGVVIGAIAVAFMVVGVQALPDGLLVRRLIGTRKLVPIQQVGAVVMVREYQVFGAAAAPMLAIADTAGTSLVKLTGQLFSGEALLRFAQVFGPRVEYIGERTTPALLADRHPKLVPFWERRPMTFGFLVVGVIVVLAVAVFAAAGAFS